MLKTVMLLGLGLVFVGSVLAADVEVNNATVRQPMPGRTVSSGYLSLQNTANQSIRLTSVSSRAFERVELHQHSMHNGMMQMEQLPYIELAALQTVQLQPGGIHLMLFSPTQPLEQATQVELVLHWSDDTKQSIAATVTQIPKQ